LSGFARKTAQSVSDFASVVHELIMDVRDSYRPEQHYMRGPGPERRAKHQPWQSDGAVIADCMLEIWQADAQGRFSDPQDKRALPNSSFKGFGRCGTDQTGGYAFDTIKPGPVPDPDGKLQAPHILLAVFARGMLLHLYTRIYFDDEAAKAGDSVFALVPAHRRATLIAKRKIGAGHVYTFDVHLQGDNETVFFDL
jgi:protocatechuate 3,4-dioxygenase alpha subunit